MAHLLGGEALHLEFPTKRVFDEITVGVSDGDRIGIVGRNGDGKSSLLAMLSGRLEPHGGRVTAKSGLRIGVLDQTDTVDPDHTVAQAIVGDVDDYVWAGNPLVRDVLDGLVSDVPWHGRVGDLSGGQRRRVALAALLAGDYDVLCLDEPTNHLDVGAITWLAAHLKKRWSASSGGLLVVTHDRWFLDEVCNATWEVHDGIVEPFEGGYAAYILQRVERDRMAAASEAKRQNLMRKELAWLRRGAPARTAKPKFRIDAANMLIENEPPPRDTVELKQMATARLGKDVVDILDVGVSYGDHEVLRDLTWLIAPGERTGIMGVNGAGKSTLLGLVTGAVQPTVGRVKRGKTVKVVTLTQELDELEELANDRVSDVIGRYRTSYVADGKEMSPGQLLERLGFTSAQLSTPVQDLSGGQKRRLQLLLILLDEPNVLVLDEPSNDLDTDMLAAMEDLLDSWPGTLLVVSHDRYLMERVTDQQYAIVDGEFRHMPGGVEQYLEVIAAQEQAQRSSPTGRSTRGATGFREATSVGHGAAKSVVAKEETPPSGENEPNSSVTLSGAELHAARKEISALERKIVRLEARTVAIHDQMATHDQADYEGLGALTAELKSIESEISTAEDEWLVASERVG